MLALEPRATHTHGRSLCLSYSPVLSCATDAFESIKDAKVTYEEERREQVSSLKRSKSERGRMCASERQRDVRSLWLR